MMYFVIKEPTAAQSYNNSSRVKQHFQVLLVKDLLISIFHWSWHIVYWSTKYYTWYHILWCNCCNSFYSFVWYMYLHSSTAYFRH